MIWPKMRKAPAQHQAAAPTTNMRYTIQAIGKCAAEPGPEQIVVAPGGFGVYVEIVPLGHLKVLAEPTSDKADELPTISASGDTRTLQEYAADLLADDELSEADEIAALLGAAGLPCRVWQIAATERTVRYTIEVEVSYE